jgi:MFS family permease
MPNHVSTAGQRSALPSRLTTGAGTRCMTLPRAAAFWVLAAIFLLMFFASTAASPLYGVYQTEFRFSAITLTAVFAVYVGALMVTLVALARLSDHVGRRPVIIAGLIVGGVACGIFLAAHGVGALYVARCLQGIATGMETGAVGASLTELEPTGSTTGPLITAAFAPAGVALGGLVASVLVEYATALTKLVWWLLLGIFALGVVFVAAMKEPGTIRPGALRSLRPRVGVPSAARRAFAAAVPCFVAVWAPAGLYLSLGLSLAAQLTGSANLLWGGLVIFLLSGTGAAAAFALRNVSSRSAMLWGCLALLAGLAVTFAATATSTSAAFIAGTAVAGVGFGPAWLGAFRMVVALGRPGESAGLLAATFIVAYLAFSVPALIAGITTAEFGLKPTALVYSGCVAGLSAAAIGALVLQAGARPRRAPAARMSIMPPGPGTCPPCRQAVDADQALAHQHTSR